MVMIAPGSRQKNYERKQHERPPAATAPGADATALAVVQAPPDMPMAQLQGWGVLFKGRLSSIL